MRSATGPAMKLLRERGVQWSLWAALACRLANKLIHPQASGEDVPASQIHQKLKHQTYLAISWSL